jgi:hypothetical protein
MDCLAADLTRRLPGAASTGLLVYTSSLGPQDRRTCSGDPSGEGFAFNNFFYKIGASGCFWRLMSHPTDVSNSMTNPLVLEVRHHSPCLDICKRNLPTKPASAVAPKQPGHLTASTSCTSDFTFIPLHATDLRQHCSHQHGLQLTAGIAKAHCQNSSQFLPLPQAAHVPARYRFHIRVNNNHHVAIICGHQQ